MRCKYDSRNKQKTSSEVLLFLLGTLFKRKNFPPELATSFPINSQNNISTDYSHNDKINSLLLHTWEVFVITHLFNQCYANIYKSKGDYEHGSLK